MRSEFEFIRNLKEKYGLTNVGDDCAILPKDSKTDLVITADLLVQDIDFRTEWTTPELVGQKALAVSLSDVAAMGATPKWAMVTLGIPEQAWRTGFAEKFYEGWQRLAKHHRVELVGGDVSRTPDRIIVDSIVAGEISKGRAIRRSGAQPGDSIFVTGALGGAAGGLVLLDGGLRYATAGRKRKELIARQLRPIPRVDVGRILARRKLATAMIDISDGLASDLTHLCAASGVGAIITAEELPIDDNLAALGPDADGFALNGGEDFELLFTSARKKISVLDPVRVTRIGMITEDAGIVKLSSRHGTTDLTLSGYRHF